MSLKIGEIMRVWSPNGTEYYGQAILHSFSNTWAITPRGRMLVPAIIMELTQEPNKGIRVMSLETFSCTEQDYIQGIAKGDVPSTFIRSMSVIAKMNRVGKLYQGGVLVAPVPEEKIPEDKIQSVKDMINSPQIYTYNIDLSAHNIPNQVVMITSQEFTDPEERFMYLFIDPPTKEIVHTQLTWIFVDEEPGQPEEKPRPKLTLVH